MKADEMKNTQHSVYATQMGAFLPNLVSVSAVMILVGTCTSSRAEKLRYLLPETLVELMMVPLYTKVQQKKQPAISSTRSRIFLDRSTDSRCSRSGGADSPAYGQHSFRSINQCIMFTMQFCNLIGVRQPS